ncbi:MAG: hemerythrin domain-containing protein [Acidovorax sp.]|jgi:hemerythrin-like domain-containing protein|uniref:hemerythrin domain-containing protein n=1 Tax=Acidovorax sp. TaxID=1872122 RepID=UPI0026327B18|nr:hemerythrin domain-containing protein [Acidovorax sp.]MDH4427384.1 hemerythrin domain-containing protein [Acidovorax sp.]
MASSPGAPARHLPGFSTPAVGFDEPFAMLQACHERVQRTLDLLTRLRDHVQSHGADQSARDAARDVLRYFDIAAPLHHQDEELHVFPLLLAQGSATMQALVERLQDDHRHMAADWAAARLPLQQLVSGEATAFTPGDDVAMDRFARRYADHIAAEEGSAYPAAEALLAPRALAGMGQEMAGRRGAGGWLLN